MTAEARPLWPYVISASIIWFLLAIILIDTVGAWLIPGFMVGGAGVFLWRVYLRPEPLDRMTRYVGGLCLEILVLIFFMCVGLPLLGDMVALVLVFALAGTWPFVLPIMLIVLAAPLVRPQIVPRWVRAHPLRVVLVALIVVGLRGWSIWHDSVDYMKRNFFRYQAEFEELARMSNQDYSVTGVESITFDPGTPDHPWSWSGSGSISRARFDKYAALCRVVGISKGVQRTGKDKEKVFLPYREGGWALSGYQHAYVWSREKPVSVSTASYLERYTPLIGNWYLLYIED